MAKRKSSFGTVGVLRKEVMHYGGLSSDYVDDFIWYAGRFDPQYPETEIDLSPR